jgi:hypothetical protein
VESEILTSEGIPSEFRLFPNDREEKWFNGCFLLYYTDVLKKEGNEIGVTFERRIKRK